MTDIEENGQRPALWDFAKYAEIYVTPMCDELSLHDLGAIVAEELKKHGAVVVIKGEPA